MTRIFLLDDHEMVREGLRAVLQAAGHSVVGEAAITEGLADRLLEVQAEVLILDLHLQGVSGLSVLQSIQKRCSGLRTVVLSMSSQASQISEALRLGALGYVLKGSPSVDLLKAIEAVISGNQYLGENVKRQVGALTNTKRTTSPIEQLSTREKQILELVVRGRTSASIAISLELSPKTVETYRSRMMTKLGINDLPSLVRFSIQWGLVDVNEPPSD